jgi:transcriptional regulator with XRE-family HTH domain
MGILDTEKIAALRAKKKWTQEEAAQAAGLNSRQDWNGIESGRRESITLTTLAKIAKALGVRAKDLLK